MVGGSFRGGVARVLAVLVAVCASAACPTGARAADPPDPGSTQSFTFASGGNDYPYLVYVPTSYDRARPAPLLVMAHGCQTSAEQQMRANLYNPIAEREGFIVLYPDVDATEVAQPGPTARCWQFPSPANWHRDSGDPAAIAGMTRTVMARWHVDPERVYLMGMSAGSFMTSVMAAAYPELYAAVGIMAGGAYGDGTCLFGAPGIPVESSAQLAFVEMGSRARVIPRLVMGGDADQGISPACADKAFEQGLRTNNLVLGDSQTKPISLKAASVREEPASKPGGYASMVSTYRDPNGCLIGERWLIHGMNHFWSGGTTDPRYKSFTDPKGPSGAEASWRFFSRYTKSSTAMPCAEVSPASTPKSATAAVTCQARWVTVRLPAGVRRLRATVNGRRATVRVVRGHVRVKLPAARRARTSVVVRGRSAAGRAVVRRVRSSGCGG